MATRFLPQSGGDPAHGPTVLDGRYRQEKILGKGSFGTANLMTRLQDNCKVVMKTIDLVGMKAGDAELARQESKARALFTGYSGYSRNHLFH